MPQYIDCHLCGSKEKRIYHRINSGIDIVQCKRCGLVYLNPQPSVEEIRKLYSKDYFNHTYLKKEAHSRLRNTARLILEEVERYHQPGRILDIGAAGGHSLKVAQEKGWEPFGVEISSYATSWAKENFDLDILSGTLEEAKFPDDFFDAIIMSHTLEHLPHPLATLQEACRVLKRRGIVYIAVPSLNLLKAKVRRKENLGALRDEEHLYWFSPQTLKAMLEKVGFKILKVDTCNLFLSLEGLTKIGLPPIIVNRVRAFVNKHFSYPKKRIRYFIGKMIPGDGIIIYALKRK